MQISNWLLLKKFIVHFLQTRQLNFFNYPTNDEPSTLASAIWHKRDQGVRKSFNFMNWLFGS